MKPLLPLLLAFAAMPAVAPAAAQAGSPIFSYGCVDSHVGRFDPIVAPGQPDVGHEHLFSGNWTTNPDSTYSSMVGAASLNPGTTCVAGDDRKPATVAQWIPTLRDAANGDKLIGLSSNTVYYVPGKVSASNPDIINAVPANLKLITDMSKGALYGAGWHCGDATPPSKGGTLSATTIPDCNNRGDGRGGVFPDDTRLQAKLVFPDCLKVDSEGKPVLDSPDHRSHAAYSGSAGCPSTHPYIIPRINHKNQFETFGGRGTDLRLASDTDGDGRANDGDSMHSDYWNTWQQSEHQRRVKRCLHDAETYDTSKPPCGSTDIMKGAENPRYPNYFDTGGSTDPEPEPEPTPAACEDATDDDNDGKVDLNDPGCSSSTDTDETDPAPEPTPAQCQDGRDDDGDGKIDMNDPGCSESADDDEVDPVTEPSRSDWSLVSPTTLSPGQKVDIPDVLGDDTSYTVRVDYSGDPGSRRHYLMHVGNSPSNRVVIYKDGSALRAAITVNGSAKTLSTTWREGNFTLVRNGSRLELYQDKTLLTYSTSVPTRSHDLGPGAMGAMRDGSTYSYQAPGTYHSASVDSDAVAP